MIIEWTFWLFKNQSLKWSRIRCVEVFGVEMIVIGRSFIR